MDLIVKPDGLLTERSVHDLAAWYSGDGTDQESFEAHLMMLRAYGALVTPGLRGRRTPLSIERYSLLRLLHREPGRRLSMGDIGRALDVSPTSITKLVNGLVAMDLVRRVPDARDRRRTWIEITERGSRLVEESLPEVRRFTRSRWQGLTADEKRMLIHLLAKLLLTNQSSEAEERLQALRSEAALINARRS
jgi:DNA-binding MarR family transcriptional regulator